MVLDMNGESHYQTKMNGESSKWYLSEDKYGLI
jgi:hypothetical protein